MTALHRKLLRDAWHMKGQAIAIALVLACGVAMFVMSRSTVDSLERTMAGYYDRHRFANVFAHLKRAPQPLADRIAEIPGVSQVQTRVVVDVTLDVADMAEPAAGRLIAIPDMPRPGINSVYLRGGRYIEPGRVGEVLASESFVDAHGFKPGAQVRAVINGRLQVLTIVGVALSPEYIYQIRPGDILPDDRRFGVFWMSETELAAAFDMKGAFNDVSIILMPGASEPEVVRRLDRLTESYGGLGAHGRSDQPSHKFISNEIMELRGMGKFVPVIFLGVAAFLLNVVLSRLIQTQREQIAALKAFGYTRYEVGWHYLQFVLLIVVLGGAVGTVTGAWMGRAMTQMYTRFFHFPVFAYYLDVRVILLAIAVSAIASISGALSAVRRAMRLPPAEAMRPEPPANYRPTIIERIGFQRFVSPAARMILRHLERQPIKSFFSCCGIGMAVAVLILGNFMKDAIDSIMEGQFFLAQRYDLSVFFVEPSSASALSDMYDLPGVRHCEPFRSVPVRLRAGPRSRRLGIMGVRPEGELFRVMDVRRRIVPIPPEGVVMSAKLGEILAVERGDRLTVEVLEGARPVREVVVADLVADFEGLSAYMDIAALGRLMREGNLLSGAFLSVDAAAMDTLYRELKLCPRLAGVSVKLAALRSFEATVAENMMRMRAFNVFFAVVIAFGVVYNSARIALSERSRELATLRVLGFTRAEISMILLGELAVLTIVAIPGGLLLGYGLCALVIQLGFNTELFRIPLVVNRSTYAFAASVTLTAAVVSGLWVRRLLDRLNLVAVLKDKE